MAPTPSPSPEQGVLAPADRKQARRLREEVRAAIERLLAEQPAPAPGAPEEERVRALIAGRVVEFQRRAVSTNRPALVNPPAVEEWLFNEFLRQGQITHLMRQPNCEELMINGPHRCFQIVDGVKRLVPEVWWESDEELLALVRRLIGPLGKRLDASQPTVDCRLPDGSRLNAIIPPASARWTYVTIRRFVARAHTLADSVRMGTLPEDIARFLDAAVRGRVSMLISGGTGSGKTTLLNACAGSIPPHERICTIEEDAPELTLAERLPDAIPLVGRRENAEGAGAISIRSLVRTALRIRPDRLIIGETRGGEALDLLLALTTGHPGSFSTIHAASPQEALDRFASLAQLGDAQLSEHAVLRMLARSLNLVLQLAQREDADGRKRRWLEEIYELRGLETGGGAPLLVGNTLWRYDEAQGRLAWTGVVPRCLELLSRRGVAYTLPPPSERGAA